MVDAVDFDAEYRFYDGKTRLNGEELNRRLLSLHQRAVALEQKGASWDALQEEGRGEALRRITAVITPLILATQGDIAAVQQAVATVGEQIAQALDDFEAQTDTKLAAVDVQIATALAGLNASIDALSDQIDVIIGGGIFATNVAETADRVFVSPAQRDRLVQIMDEYDGGTFS